MGFDRLTAYWTRLTDSLWFLPATLTAGAAVLAFVTIQLDIQGVFRLPPPSGAEEAGPNAIRILFGGTAEGARGVLGAIASGFITVTGVVFSVTIVALQLASTQFTPRILRNFTADRANQVVLGMFIGTFTYALLVQRAVRGEEGEISAFVPNLSVTVALALAITSIGFLIFFIDHAARSVQAAVIIDRVTGETLRAIERTLPDQLGEPVEDDVDERTPDGQPTLVTADASGFLQGVDHDDLLDLMDDQSLTIRMEPHVGDFIMPGTLLATVWPADLEGQEELVRGIRKVFILGHERTPHMDPELGVIELEDIAVKALSPGINDPTTAKICLDRLAQIVVAFGRREPPGRVRRKPGGRTVLIVPRPTFEHFVETAIDQIRHFGISNPHFAVSLLLRLREMGALLPSHRHPPLARQAAAALRAARIHVQEPADLARVEREAVRTLRALGGEAPTG